MDKLHKDDVDWQKELTPEAYQVLRQGGTERPFTGELLHNKDRGDYVCGACGNTIFSSDTKFDSGSGWPSFWDSIEKGHIELREDNEHGTRRVEVKCARCDSHLGHVFADAPQTPTGQRYCLNSLALKFVKKIEAQS